MVKFDIKRYMTPSDIAEVTELLHTVERLEGHRPLNDHLWIDLRQGGRVGFAGLVAWQSGVTHPVAYCQVSRGNDSWSIDLVVDPRHRHEMNDLGTNLLKEATSIIAGEGGGHLHWWVFEPTEVHLQLAQQIGLRPGRNIVQMRVNLPLAPGVVARTATITTRAFRVGVDEDEWIAVNNRAFAAHPEQGGWTREILESREAEPWFNPHGFLLHHNDEQIDGRLAGFCWTKVHAKANTDVLPTLGEIYVIAVDPAHHGKGLGRALTVAGLTHLAAVGTATGMLFVDKDNLAAITMYRDIGFDTHHEEQAFVGDIAPSAK